LEEIVGCIYRLMNFTRKDDMDVENVVGLICNMTLRDCPERANIKGEQFKKHKRKNAG